MNTILRKNYSPAPFWARDPIAWQKYDEAAVEIYRNTLPDYEVIPIDCSILANGGGGINCTTHEIPDFTRLNRN